MTTTVTAARVLLLISTGACFVVPIGCTDPVHDSAVRSLGPENPAVPIGALHRPGQPCLICHGSEGPAAEFSLGGTVYAVLSQPQPAEGAMVQIEDIENRNYAARTNSAGNFFARPNDFTPHFPIKMKVSSADGATTQLMQTSSAREGSCAGCHANPASPTSPGPVFLAAAGAAAATTDGGP